MDAAIALALTLLREAGVIPGAPQAARRTAAVLLACGFGALLVAAAAGLAVSAGWLALLPLVGAAWAPLILAGGLLALAVPLFVFVQRRLAVEERQAPALLPAAEALAHEAGRLVAAHKGSLLLAALVAGLLTEQEARRR